MEAAEESPRPEELESSGEADRPWGWRDLFNPLLWAVALVSLLILALYCTPLLLFVLDRDGGSLSDRLLSAAGAAPSLLIFYLLIFFAGGFIGPESRNKVRRFCAQALMIFGILPLAILAIWSQVFRRRGSGGSGGDSPDVPAETGSRPSAPALVREFRRAFAARMG